MLHEIRARAGTRENLTLPSLVDKGVRPTPWGRPCARARARARAKYPEHNKQRIALPSSIFTWLYFNCLGRFPALVPPLSLSHPIWENASSSYVSKSKKIITFTKNMNHWSAIWDGSKTGGGTDCPNNSIEIYSGTELKSSWYFAPGEVVKTVGADQNSFRKRADFN